MNVSTVEITIYSIFLKGLRYCLVKQNQWFKAPCWKSFLGSEGGRAKSGNSVFFSPEWNFTLFSP